MNSSQECDAYARELRDFEAERHSEHPAFNEDFMVPRHGLINPKTTSPELDKPNDKETLI
jgi:hypothetical protein